MAIAARLQKEGKLLLNDSLNERLPVVTDGLIAHYPLDGKGGGFDIIGGAGSVQNLESYTNLIEAMDMDWRDPSSWNNFGSFAEWHEGYQALKITGYRNSWLKTPIVVDTTKEYQVSMEIMEEVQSGTGLYLGGLCNNAAGQKVTTNYDYSYAANAQPTTGVWTTYRTTRTGTGAIVSRTSTSFANNSGWMGTAQSDNLTKYYHYGGLFNYSSGGVMYIRNLSIVAIDADTSNTVDIGEGIAIQLATTNVIAGDFDTSFESLPIGNTAGFTSQLGTGGEYGVANFGYNSNKSLRVLSGTDSYKRIYRTTALPISTDFAVSAWVYSTTAGPWIRFEYNGGDYAWAVEDVQNTHTGSGWELLWCYAPTTTSSTTAYYMIYPGQTQTAIFVDNILAEYKTYSSAYVNGTSSNSLLSILNPVKTGEYTVNFNVKILTNIGTAVGYQTLMSMGDYYTNNSWTIMDNISPTVGGTQRLIRKGNAGEWAWNGGNLTTPSNFREWNTITIVRNATNYVTYSNGVQLNSLAHASTTMQDYVYIGSRNAGDKIGASIIKDLSFYDRALDGDEIKKLASSPQQISENNTIVDTIVESPVLPNGAYYYPLANNSLDYTNTKDASDNANSAYEDRAIWVGTATNNNYGTPDFNTATASANWNHWGSTGHLGTYGQNTDRDFILTPSNTYSHWVANGAGSPVDYLLYQACTYDGGYRSMQGIIKMSDGSPVTNAKVSCSANAWNGGSPTGSWTSINHIGGGWYHCKWEGFSQDGTNDLVFFRIHAGYKAYFDFAQLEDYKQFASPMKVYGTRAASSLEFNFYDSIGLDWSGDWSLSYWKKPLATYTDFLTGYSIESFGSNSNTVGGGYYWYGKSNNANTLASSTPTDIIPANYFNHWHWISHVKTGSNIVTTTRGIEGNLLSVRNTTTTTTVANYYVNPYGYDFKLSGWDNTNPTNMYARDLVVVKRAITAAEEDSLYTQMSIYKNKTLLKNIIEQGI